MTKHDRQDYIISLLICAFTIGCCVCSYIFMFEDGAKTAWWIMVTFSLIISAITAAICGNKLLR